MSDTGSTMDGRTGIFWRMGPVGFLAGVLRVPGIAALVTLDLRRAAAMKRLLAATAVVLVSLSPGAMSAGRATMPLHDAPRPLPAVSFTDEGGNPTTLRRWRGRIVLLNVWATWCGPCRREMPTLDRLQARLGGDGFAVVALSIDRAGTGAVRRFFDEIGIRHLDIFVDDTMRAARDLKTPGLPATLLIGRDGRELGRSLGPAEWDTPEMIAFLNAVIADTTGKKTTP